MNANTRSALLLLCIAAGACNDKVDTGLEMIDFPAEADAAVDAAVDDVDASAVDERDAGVVAELDGATVDAAVVPPPPADLTGIPSFAVHVAAYGQTTGVTLLDGEGALVGKELYLNSGTQLPGLSAALASDIALPTQACDPSLLSVVQRKGSNVIQVDLRKATVKRQFSTQRAEATAAGAYESNPQDMLCISGDRALISRLQPNDLAGAAALDLGDDLVLVDLTTGTITERIALDDFRGSAGGELAYTRPGSIVRTGKRAVVGLGLFSLTYAAATPGKVLVVDLDTFAPTAVPFAKLANCGTVVPVADRDDAVIVSCAGSPYGNPDNAGLAFVSLDTDGKATVEAEFQAAVDGMALYASPTSIGGSRVIAAAMDQNFTAPDRGYVLDVLAGSYEKSFDGSENNGIGSGAMRFETGLVLVPDTGVGVRMFHVVDGELTADAPLALRSDVPARAVRPMRTF